MNTYHRRIFLVYLLLYTLINFLFSSHLKIYFIDVNQGDAALVVTPNEKTILIDAGDCDEYHDYGKDVYMFLKKLKITKLNAVIISHPHRDHIGGMYYVLSKINTDSFYDSGFPYPSQVYQQLLELIDEKRIKYYLAREGTAINLDPSVEINILYPPKIFVFDTPNDNSVVLRIKYKNIAVLFTGDIEAQAENYIVKKYRKKKNVVISNILKVPHHGSNTSSTKEFLELVEPEVAIISCGKNNRFGHPHFAVIKRYKNFGVEIYRTDIHGTIEVIIDGDDYQINQFNEYYDTIYTK